MLSSLTAFLKELKFDIMIRKILLTTISVFVLSHLSFAQPQGGSIKGKVNDETGEGFPIC